MCVCVERCPSAARNCGFIRARRGEPPARHGSAHRAGQEDEEEEGHKSPDPVQRPRPVTAPTVETLEPDPPHRHRAPVHRGTGQVVGCAC